MSGSGQPPAAWKVAVRSALIPSCSLPPRFKANYFFPSCASKLLFCFPFPFRRFLFFRSSRSLIRCVLIGNVGCGGWSPGMASHVGRDGRRAPHHVATDLRGSAPVGLARRP